MSEKLPISECHRAGHGAQGDGGDGEACDLTLLPEGGGDGLADVGLVAGDVQFGVFGQQFRADRDVAGIGRANDKSGMTPLSVIRRCAL